ncbi:GDSL-type esterase/lipase family protein [Pseudonocardia humida]|uniref:GDSL-type esterase/lipase family protein n=1 Tax=Pseudonocardia humida TaxID=2800819 RepID=UPI00207C2B6C|nr:GDSL-type esterase/lipase family protein [Pseudonocardia humida]
MTRTPRRPGPAVTVAALAACALLGAALLGAPSAAADPRPTAVVVLGDSVASGEGAGDYEEGTRGEGGNWCHRSAHAYVHRTGLAERSVNLACSGADSADVAFGPGTDSAEGSQAERLVEVATRYRVTTVLVQLGSNDDAALVATAIACIRAFLDVTTPPCRQSVGPLLDERMAATAVKVQGAVQDVRRAMERAGYRPDRYQLVLSSYAAASTEHMVGVPGLIGCPYSRADAGWGRTTLFPRLSAALAGVAERTGARFLDMTRATEGREACSRPDPAQEWQRRLTVDPHAFAYGGLDAAAYHVAAESFHPSAAGQAAFGGCVGEFVRSSLASAACVPVDGGLQVQRTVQTPAA